MKTVFAFLRNTLTTLHQTKKDETLARARRIQLEYLQSGWPCDFTDDEIEADWQQNKTTYIKRAKTHLS